MVIKDSETEGSNVITENNNSSADGSSPSLPQKKADSTAAIDERISDVVSDGEFQGDGFDLLNLSLQDTIHIPEQVIECHAYDQWAIDSEEYGPNHSAIQDPLRLTHRHRALARMAAVGATTRQISMQLGISEQHVRRLIRSPAVRDLIEEYQESAFSLELLEKSKSITEDALQEIKTLLDDPNTRGAVKVEAAKLLFGLHFGRLREREAASRAAERERPKFDFPGTNQDKRRKR